MKDLLRFFVACMLLSATSYAGNYTWTGTTNSSWNTNTNWNPNGNPGSSDTITINTTTTSLVLTGKKTVKRLVMTNDTLDLGGDTLEITGSAGFNGGHIMNGVCYLQATGLLSFAGTTFGAEVKAKGQIKLNGCTFNSTAYFEHTGSAAGTGSGGNTFNGTTTLKNAGTSAFRLAGSANDTFNGDVTVISAATSGSGSMQLSAGGSSYFNGNIVVNSTTVFGISFSSAGAGSSVLASGKTISIGGSGFVGTLLMRNFTQLGTTSQTLSFNGILNIMNSEFNGSLTSSSTNLLLTGNNFHGVCSFTKIGISSDYSAGGNHFYQDLTIQNNVTNTAIIRMASTNGDVYEGDVTLNTSTGFIQMAYSDTSDFLGDISINSTKVNFNSGAGYVRFTGSSVQTLAGSVNYSFAKFILDKTSGEIVLGSQVTIDSLINLESGNISTSTSNFLILKASCTLIGGTTQSYIIGPMTRYGASSFIYPVGSNEKFRPITVSGSNVITDALKIQFIDSALQNPNSSDTTIMLNSCESWKVEYLANSKNRIFTIPWDSVSCSIPRNSEIVVAGWNGTTWKNLGKSGISGGYLQGSVTSNDSASSTKICIGTLKNNLTIDSVFFGELLDYSLYTRDSILLKEQIYSKGKVGADYINQSVNTDDSVLINFSGSTTMASNSLINILETLNSLSKTALDTTLFKNGTLSNGIYEINTDLYINNQIALDSNKRYIIFVKGKLFLGGNCVFSSKVFPSKNVLFITDSLIIDESSFINASFISFREFIQIGEAQSSKTSIFSLNNIFIENDSSDFLEYAAYFHPNFIYHFGACTNQTVGCNLVLNPGFSENIFQPFTWGGILHGDCCNWSSPTPGTPDYFHQDGNSQFNAPTQILNASATAFQPDHGIYGGGINAYAGLCAFVMPIQDGREYLQGNLATGLANQQYYGEFYANLFDMSWHNCNRLGMFVSQNAPSATVYGLLSGINPQIEHDPATNISSSTNWTLVNGCFTANGGENFVTIGNFYNDANTAHSPVPTIPPFQFEVAHYLIDDVSVLPIEVSAGPDVTISCTGTTQLGGSNCLESLNPGQFTYSWSLVSGSTAFGSLSSSSVQFPTFTANNTSPTAQTMVYQVQISTPGGCTAIDQVSITVNSCCSIGTISLTTSPTSVLCTGQNLTINSSISGGTTPYTYLWNTGDNTSSITINVAGNYAISVTDFNGCTGSATINITSGGPPQAVISGSNFPCIDNGVNGIGVNLPYSIVNPDPSYTYSWSSISAPPGWNIQSPLSISIASSINPTIGTSTQITYPNVSGYPSNYILQVVTSDQNGCTSTTFYSVDWCCSSFDINAYDHVWLNESASNVTTPSPTETVLIRGTFTVDVSNLFWINLDITMDPGAEIIVPNGSMLNIRSSHLSPCESFWKSITVDGGYLGLNYSEIEGAQYAVDVKRGGSYTINLENVFRDNYTSLRVDGASGNTRIFSDNTITRTYLYDVYFDFNGQSPQTCYAANDYPSHGILLSNAGYNIIGAPISGFETLIEKVRIGIEAAGTDLKVTNTTIQDLFDRPCVASVNWRQTGVYVPEQFSLNRIQMTDQGPFRNIIQNCYNGIYINNADISLNYNLIQNVDYGIRYFNPPNFILGQKTTMNSNEIYTSLAGINVNCTSSSAYRLEIKGNKIYDDQTGISNNNGYGIFVADLPALGKALSINKNEITAYNGFRNGIIINSGSDFICDDNTINLNNQFGIINGININNSSSFAIRRNIVTNNVTNTNSTGIRINVSGGGLNSDLVNCNDVTNCQRGFRFISSSLNLDWASNNVYGGATGLRMEGGAQLFRDQPWNEWCGTFSNWLVNGSGAFNVINWIQDPSLGNTCTGITSPTAGQVNNISYVIAASTSVEPTCPLSITPVSEITDHDRYVTLDSIIEQMDENLLWQYRRSLANKLSISQDLVETDSTINLFWHNQDWDEIRLALMMNQVTLMDSINRPYLNSMTIHKDLISDIQALISYNDSLLFTGLSNEDSIRIVEETIFHHSQLDSIFQIVDSLNSIAFQKIDSCRIAVLENYVGFDPHTEFGAIESDIWRLILTYGYSGSNLPSIDDLTLIANYSNLCMSEYGSAIGIIRTLYYSLTNELITDDDVCGSSEKVRKNTIVGEEELVLNLVPNPTKDYVTLKFNRDINDTYQISITSLNGEFVKSYHFTNTEPIISIENLHSGIYFVHLHYSGGDLYRKLVIIR